MMSSPHEKETSSGSSCEENMNPSQRRVVPQPAKNDDMSPLTSLLSRVNDHRLKQAPQSFGSRNASSSSSSPDPFGNTPPGLRTDSVISAESAEVKRLKMQLELTTERMAQMDMEINSFRLAQRTVEQVVGSPYPAPQTLARESSFVNSYDTGAPMINQSGPYVHHAPKHEHLLYNSSSMSSFARPHAPNYDNLRVQSSVHPFGYGMHPPIQAPIGTPLSPTASEFSTWQPVDAKSTQVNYLSTVEPLNYRRLLDRNASCDWKYIVDKIVCNNDQQASIFLQQKLKVGTAEQKYDIIRAIIDQAYNLMINRFGNFLVQRCFEHGTPEQIIGIAQAIHGKTLMLSMDPFGCHVIQKAFDYVPEDHKAIMVHELLRRIPETVIHRYACHVWQKLFELRWNDSPPQIMRYVNDALCGMWHEVALGETSSLVVQNIFENCLEEDKRPCINEVLRHIDAVAHGQFGNWCIQHICEHGAVPDRTRAIDHVILYSTEYSIDQYASKVVEKCLKVAGTDFLDRFLNRICEGHPDRPRMPLIDIAGDQFGNYLIHYILSNADTQRREVVAAHIRKHMVSLRGSKYGSRVAMLCCGPNYSTRPESAASYQSTTGRYTSYWPGERPRSGDGLGRKPYIPYR